MRDANIESRARPRAPPRRAAARRAARRASRARLCSQVPATAIVPPFVPVMSAVESITLRLQAWVYFVTWVQYAANHITRKCYTNVKNVMIAMGLSKETLGRMDAGFMFTYALSLIHI